MAQRRCHQNRHMPKQRPTGRCHHHSVEPHHMRSYYATCVTHQHCILSIPNWKIRPKHHPSTPGSACGGDMRRQCARRLYQGMPAGWLDSHGPQPSKDRRPGRQCRAKPPPASAPGAHLRRNHARPPPVPCAARRSWSNSSSRTAHMPAHALSVLKLKEYDMVLAS